MKKKSKQKKTKDMPEFSFKEFTPEEGRIYEEAIGKYREAIGAGKSLRQAYESYAVADREFEALIQADFLKILIAERHFGKGESLEQVARDLNVSGDLVRDTHARMLQEVGIAAENRFTKETGGLKPKTSD